MQGCVGRVQGAGVCVGRAQGAGIMVEVLWFRSEGLGDDYGCIAGRESDRGGIERGGERRGSGRGRVRRTHSTLTEHIL